MLLGLAVTSVLFTAAFVLGTSPRVASAEFVSAPTFSAPIQAAGLTETWTIGGWRGSVSNHLTSATVVFPSGFSVPPSPTVTVRASGVACTVLRAVTTNQTVAIEITGACSTSGAAPSSQSITIAGVTNPATPGIHGASGFTLSTSVDGPMRSSNNVVIWGVTAGPVTCTTVGGQSAGHVEFASTATQPVGNTGSGVTFALRAWTDHGAFAVTPFVVGTLGVPQPAAGLKSAPSTIDSAISAGARLVVDLVAPGSSVTATLNVDVNPATGGTTVRMASTSVTFDGGVCVPPASAPPTPPPAGSGSGSFSGGTIAASGVSLVSFTGTTAQLDTAAAASKLVSVSATVSGKLLTFVVGAPSFVNADFNAAFPGGLSATLVIVKS